MTHTIRNILSVTGTPDDVREVVAQVQQSAVIPTWPHLTDAPIRNAMLPTSMIKLWNIVYPRAIHYEEYATNRRRREEWNSVTWGTTADVVGISQHISSDHRKWRVTFLSDWAPPREALALLSGQFSDVFFSNRWAPQTNWSAGETVTYEKGRSRISKLYGCTTATHKDYEGGLKNKSCLCRSEHISSNMRYPFIDCPREDVVPTHRALLEFEVVNNAHMIEHEVPFY